MNFFQAYFVIDSFIFSNHCSWKVEKQFFIFTSKFIENYGERRSKKQNWCKKSQVIPCLFSKSFISFFFISWPQSVWALLCSINGFSACSDPRHWEADRNGGFHALRYRVGLREIILKILNIITLTRLVQTMDEHILTGNFYLRNIQIKSFKSFYFNFVWQKELHIKTNFKFLFCVVHLDNTVRVLKRP